MSKRNEYPQNKSVSARIDAAQQNIAYAGAILDTVVELGTEFGNVPPRLIEKLNEARQRLQAALDAMSGVN